MGILNKLFGKIVLAIPVNSTRASAPMWKKDAYEQETVRAIIDCIATHAAKGQAMHVVLDENGRIKEIKRNSPYAKLLNQSPNPIMSGFDMKYKMISVLESKNNSLLYLKWNGTQPEMMIPIDYENYNISELKDGGYAVEFTDMEGIKRYLLLEDVVFLKRLFNTNPVYGDSNAPIYESLDMVKASDSGFIESLNVANKVRGIYKQKVSMLDPEDVKKSQIAFSIRFEEAAKKGGIVGLDSMEDYVPLNLTPYSANAGQMKAVRDNLYVYWRTPEEIVKSSYSEQVGHAWFESVIEPIWIMMGEAFTNVCFTQEEKDLGNRIIFSGGVVMGTSYATRINIILAVKELGTLSTNEQRELLGYNPVEGGDERKVSLNYVDEKHQNEYQLGKPEDKENE